MAGLGLSGAYGAAAAADSLEELIASRMAQQEFAELKAERARKDAEAREEKAFNRRRITEQDERQRRIDAQADKDKNTTRLMKLAENFPGARARRSAFGDVPSDLDALILKPLDPTLASRSITGFTSMPGAAMREGAVSTEDREAIEPGMVEIQEPESERRRIADARGAAAAEKAEKDRALREQQQRDLQQHRERMAAIAQQRVDKSGSGSGAGSMGVGSNKGELDAVADMVTSNPDLLKDFAPKDRGRILTRIASRGEGTMRNQRADSVRSMIDTATETIRRLRGDDDQGNKGQGAAGFTGAVGAKGPTSLFGILDKPIAGSDAANFAATVDTLRSQLTLPELQKLRGLGAMSDREFATLSSGATTLSRALSEEDFLTELDRIERTLAAVRSRMPDADIALDEPVIVDDPRTRSGSAATPTRDPSGGLNGMMKPRMVRVQAPNGAIREVPENEVSIFTAAGGKVVR